MSLLQYALWLRDSAIERIRHVLLGILKAGPIPHHVAFIMDGNRRYARERGVKVIEGHTDGFVALRRVRTRSTRELHPEKLKLKTISFWGGTKQLHRY